MDIYIDMAFLINFLFDAELIIMTHFICSKKVKPHRVILAALMGGFFGVLVFYPYFGILIKPPVSILIPLLLTAISVYPLKMRDFFSFYTVFLALSFSLAGIMSFMRVKVIFGLLLIFPTYLAIMKIKKQIFLKKTKITLFFGDKKIEKAALYDSGNSATYFGRPVIFANKALMSEFFDKDFSLDECPRICIVPYKTVDKSGVVTGIKLDRAVVNGKSFEGTVLGFFDGDLKEEIILNGTML